MITQSLNCPNCEAPLSSKSGQTLIICIYCNSSIRISHPGESKPYLNLIPEIPAKVVEEVKRLLVMGFTTKAVSYYANESGLSKSDACRAVNLIKKTIAYRPPMNTRGLIIMMCLAYFSFAVLLGGIYFLLSGQIIPGSCLIAASALFAYIDWFVFHNSLNAYIILSRGEPADAVILKRWDVTSYLLKRGGHAFLLRLLVEIKPDDRPVYQAEVNYLVAEQKQKRFNVNSVIKVKYNRNNPSAVIVAETA